MTPEDAKNYAEILQIVNNLIEHKPNEWLPVYAAFGGAFIGAVAAYIPSALINWSNRRNEIAQVKASIIAEIASIIEVVRIRNYPQDIQKIINEFELSEDPELEICYCIEIDESYSRIYQANCHKIGMLPASMAVDVIRFYQIAQAIVQDVKIDGVLCQGCDVKPYCNVLDLYEMVLKLGDHLTKA